MNEIDRPNTLSIAAALALLQRQTTLRPRDANETTLQIVVYRPGSIGGSPCVALERMQAGFDWDHGKMLLYPAQPLSTLSEEEKAAILANAKSAQTHHAYQQHKRIKELEAEVASLKAPGSRP